MPKNKTRVGIEITAGFLNLALFSRGKITKVYSKTLSTQASRPEGEDGFAMLSHEIKQALKEGSMPSGECAWAILPDDAYIRHLEKPLMTVDELKLVLPLDFRDYVTGSLDDYTFDYAVQEITPRTEFEPERMKLVGAAVNTAFVSSYQEAFKKAGLKLKEAFPTVLSYANIVRFNRLSDAVILDIGRRQSSVYMFHGGKYEVTRTIDVGVMNMLEEVAYRLGVSLSDARALFAARSPEVLDLPECTALYEQINSELVRAASFYEYNFRDSELSRIHYAGAGCFVRPLIDYIQSNHAVEIASISELIPNTGLDPAALERCAAACSAAMVHAQA